MNRDFSHRFNADNGTVDSICHCCFKTVATATREADLQTSERKHVCDPEKKLHFDGFAELVKTAEQASSQVTPLEQPGVVRFDTHPNRGGLSH